MARLSHEDLLALLADELDAARAQLEALGVSLIGDPLVTVRHMSELQTLDHAGQRCASVASILRSDDIYEAIRGAGLDSIARRVRSAG